MAVRDTHYLELVQRERLAEAAMEREASVAARDGWRPDGEAVEDVEPSLRRDIFSSLLHACAQGTFAAGLIIQGGWARWLGAVALVFVVSMVLASVRRIGGQLVERRKARTSGIGI